MSTPADGPRLEYWFELASTYSHPAALRLESLAAARGVSVAWKPFLLGPIFRDLGWSDSPFNLQPAKGRHMGRDLERVCAAHGLPWRRPSAFPRNGLAAARVACRWADEPWLPAFVRAVYRANFAEDRDIATAATLERCLALALEEAGGAGGPAAAGPDPAALLAESRSEASKAALRAQTEAAARHGIFGAPSFRVGDELFWGHDRIEQALDWAAGTAPRPPAPAPTP